MPEKVTLSLKEAAARLQVDPRRVKESALAGDLPSIRLGRRLEILREPLERLLRGEGR
jgi:hypothetical protein